MLQGENKSHQKRTFTRSHHLCHLSCIYPHSVPSCLHGQGPGPISKAKPSTCALDSSPFVCSGHHSLCTISFSFSSKSFPNITKTPSHDPTFFLCCSPVSLLLLKAKLFERAIFTHTSIKNSNLFHHELGLKSDSFLHRLHLHHCGPNPMVWLIQLLLVFLLPLYSSFTTQQSK